VPCDCTVACGSEFFLQATNNGDCYGPYVFSNGATILNGHASILLSSNNTFRLEVTLRGVTKTIKPVVFKNGGHVVVDGLDMLIVTQRLPEVVNKAAAMNAKWEDAAAFARSQRGKGLVMYDGRWLSPEEYQSVLSQNQSAGALAGKRTETYTVETALVCARCGGRGYIGGLRRGNGSLAGTSRCPACGGRGQITKREEVQKEPDTEKVVPRGAVPEWKSTSAGEFDKILGR
jgi:hypothetical protein